jgi:hypothetical protein
MVEQIVPLPPFIAPLIGAEEAPRRTVEWIIEQLIESLDTTDGDPDLEETDAEDSFVLSPIAKLYADDGPGCPIADPDYAVDDRPCDAEIEDGI